MTTTPLASKVAELERELAEAKKQLALLPKPLTTFDANTLYSSGSTLFFVACSTLATSNITYEELAKGETKTGARVAAVSVGTAHKGMLLWGLLPRPENCEKITGTLSYVGGK